MGKKKDWETKFEQYDTKKEELNTKFESKNITKEEYSELKKMLALEKNINQVANIIELKNKLEVEREEIREKIKKAKTEQEKVPNNNENLEEELNKIQEELAVVTKNLKNPNLLDTDRKNLEKKYVELMAKRDENNKKFVESQNTKKEVSEKVDIKALKEKEEELGIKIGKCHFAGRLLMAGKTWNDIYVKYDQNEKYTSKDQKITDKFNKENKTIINSIGNSVKQIMNSKKENEEDNKENKKEEKALVAQSKFEQKHPKLAKFFNSVKNIFNRKENKVEKNKEVEEEKEVKEVKEVKEEIKSQRDEFMDYLKQVAEKGMEKQAEDTLKEKFAQNKKEAYKRETEKFGKNYADRSYNSKENDEKEL